jgi:hypothetical protein
MNKVHFSGKEEPLQSPLVFQKLDFWRVSRNLYAHLLMGGFIRAYINTINLDTQP